LKSTIHRRQRTKEKVGPEERNPDGAIDFTKKKNSGELEDKKLFKNTLTSTYKTNDINTK